MARGVLRSAALGVLLWAAPARAQQFGQWSWQGTLGGGQRFYENLVNGERATMLRETNIGLGLGLNGYLLHPAIGKFTLGIEGTFQRYNEGAFRGTDRLGFRGNLQLFPQGRYPLRLFASHARYDYSTTPTTDPMTLLGVPDRSTELGARVQARAGLLVGTTLGFERSSLQFVEEGTPAQVVEREFLDWSRAGRSLQHHVQLERENRTYGTVSYETEDLRATLEEHGRLSRSSEWRWDFSGLAFRRNLKFEGASDSFDTLTLRNNLAHPVGSRNQVDLSYDGSFLTTPGMATVQSHDVVLRYLFRPTLSWDLTPFVAYGLQTSRVLRTTAPRAGLAAGWRTGGKVFDIAVTASGSIGTLSHSAGSASSTDKSWSGSAGATLGHTWSFGLREELDGSWVRNQLRRAGDLIAELPTGGSELAGTGTEDATRARLSVRKSWQGIGVAAYGDWSRREVTSPELSGTTSVEGFLGNAQINLGPFTAAANLGDSKVRGASSQDLRFFTAVAALRPIRALTMTASYREDRRRLLSAPSLDGRRVEAGLDFMIGQFSLVARGFSGTEQLVGGIERGDRGVTWVLTRRFGGWLPFVSAPVRRGVVR